MILRFLDAPSPSEDWRIIILIFLGRFELPASAKALPPAPAANDGLLLIAPAPPALLLLGVDSGVSYGPLRLRDA